MINSRIWVENVPLHGVASVYLIQATLRPFPINIQGGQIFIAVSSVEKQLHYSPCVAPHERHNNSKLNNCTFLFLDISAKLLRKAYNKISTFSEYIDMASKTITFRSFLSFCLSLFHFSFF